MPTVLIVHEDATMREYLRQLVGAEVGPEVEIGLFGAFEPVCAALLSAGAAPLVVASASAPALEGGRREAVAHGAAIGFVREARARWPALDLLLLWTEEENAELHRVAEDTRRARLVRMGPRSPGWKQSLRDCARLAVRAPPPAGATLAQRTHTILNIHLRGGGCGQWSLEHRGRVERALPPRAFTVDLIALDDMLRRSGSLPRTLAVDDWANHLPEVAHNLARMLFGKGKLRQAYEESTGDEQRQQLRLVFGLTPELQRIPVELLKRLSTSAQEEQWHTLNTPMLRQYEGSTTGEPGAGSAPLFRDPASRAQPVNCLIVAADPADGYSLLDDRSYEWHRLHEVQAEVREIEQALEAARVAHPGRIGRVQVLELAGSGDTYVEFLHCLASEEWHIVHFAGHSFVHPGAGGRGEPQLVLRAAGGGVLLGFAALARVLGRVRFLFLSSCQSADADFLGHAVREFIPSIVGYRWAVPDTHARALAADFYSALFGGPDTQHSLARALLHARQCMFRLHPEAPTWAAPLLMVRGDASATAHPARPSRSVA